MASTQPDDIISRVARQYVRSDSYLDADDLAQEARIAQWENPEASTLRWSMLDANRRSLPGSRSPTYRPARQLKPWDDEADVADELVHDEADVARLALALNRLRPRSRYLLVAHYWHGVPLGDIAADYGITISRASQIHRRALAALRQAMLPGVAPVSGPATHCPSGHPYDDANTYVRPSGYRACRTCKRARDRRAWHRR